MELTTFGSALKFGIELENTAMEAFAEAAEAATAEDARKLFMELSASSRDRKVLLQKLYEENVYSDMDTGIFEPLPVMDGSRYAGGKPSAEAGAAAFLKDALGMESRTGEFYGDFASRMKARRRAVGKKLEKLAGESLDRKSRIERLGRE